MYDFWVKHGKTSITNQKTYNLWVKHQHTVKRLHTYFEERHSFNLNGCTSGLVFCFCFISTILSFQVKPGRHPGKSYQFCVFQMEQCLVVKQCQALKHHLNKHQLDLSFHLGWLDLTKLRWEPIFGRIAFGPSWKQAACRWSRNIGRFLSFFRCSVHLELLDFDFFESCFASYDSYDLNLQPQSKIDHLFLVI